MTRVRILSIEVEATPNETMALVQSALQGSASWMPQATLWRGPVPMPALSMGLDEETASCERCGCTWNDACPGGCSWDPAAWSQGHAICSQCVGAPESIAAAPAEAPPNPAEPRKTRGRGRDAEAGTTPRGKRGQHKAEIERRLAKGEKPAAIAAALGCSPQTVYGVQNRLKKAGAGGKAARGKKDAPRFRCQKCGQMGIDPVRCDNVHCHEKR